DLFSAEASGKSMQGSKQMIVMESSVCEEMEKHDHTQMDVAKSQNITGIPGNEEDDFTIRNQSLVP
ncbi:hypothetical protein HAX54_044788, partial [Datura stramonium]|nr:hypothetical protein [Datura stramonium]